MLKFKISNVETNRIWIKNNDGTWNNKSEFINVIKSDYLESCFFEDGQRQVFICRERSFAEKSFLNADYSSITKSELNSFIRSTMASEMEFIILIFHVNTAKIKIIKGVSNNVPLYYFFKENTLYASWDITDLYCHIDRNHIFSDIELLQRLSLYFNYSNKTIYNGIHILCERSEICIENSCMTIKFPEDYPIYEERLPKQHVDFTEVFSQALREQFIIHGVKDYDFICELSGGLDSAITTIAATELSPQKKLSYGLIHVDEIGVQQTHRRKELINKFSVNDTAVGLQGLWPLYNDGLSLRSKKAWAFEDIYHDAMHQAIKDSTFQGGAVLTGIGGDELSIIYTSATKLQSNAQEDRQMPISSDFIIHHKIHDALKIKTSLPRPAINRSAIRSLHSRASIFLKNNLWPINIFCVPSIVKLFQYLPAEVKQNKQLHRQYLSNKGLSNDFLYPKIRENFAKFYFHGIAKINYENIMQLMKHSYLDEMGYIDKKKYIESYTNYCNNIGNHNPLVYYIVPALEYSVRAIMDQERIDA